MILGKAWQPVRSRRELTIALRDNGNCSTSVWSCSGRSIHRGQMYKRATFAADERGVSARLAQARANYADRQSRIQPMSLHGFAWQPEPAACCITNNGQYPKGNKALNTRHQDRCTTQGQVCPPARRREPPKGARDCRTVARMSNLRARAPKWMMKGRPTSATASYHTPVKCRA